MSLKMVQKRIDELLSQKYEQEMTVPYKKYDFIEIFFTLPCMMKWNLNEDQRKKGKATTPKIVPPTMMEECDNILDE